MEELSGNTERHVLEEEFDVPDHLKKSSVFPFGKHGNVICRSYAIDELRVNKHEKCGNVRCQTDSCLILQAARAQGEVVL